MSKIKPNVLKDKIQKHGRNLLRSLLILLSVLILSTLALQLYYAHNHVQEELHRYQVQESLEQRQREAERDTGLGLDETNVDTAQYEPDSRLLDMVVVNETIEVAYDLKVRLQKEVYGESMWTKITAGGNNILSCCGERLADFTFKRETFVEDVVKAWNGIQALNGPRKRSIIVRIQAGNFEKSCGQTEDYEIGEGGKYAACSLSRESSSPTAFLEALVEMEEAMSRNAQIPSHVDFVLVTTGCDLQGSPFARCHELWLYWPEGLNSSLNLLTKSAYIQEKHKISLNYAKSIQRFLVAREQLNAARILLDHRRVKLWWMTNHDCHLKHFKLRYYPVGAVSYCCSQIRKRHTLEILTGLRKRFLFQDPDEAEGIPDMKYSGSLVFLALGLKRSQTTEYKHRLKVIHKLMDARVSKRNHKTEKEYYGGMFTTPFTASPRGISHDAYRHYHALLSGSVVLMDNHHSLRDIFADLPVIFIDEWKNVTFEFLGEHAKAFLARNESFAWHKLSEAYWDRLVRESAFEDRSSVFQGSTLEVGWCSLGAFKRDQRSDKKTYLCRYATSKQVTPRKNECKNQYDTNCKLPNDKSDELQTTSYHGLIRNKCALSVFRGSPDCKATLMQELQASSDWKIAGLE